MPVWLCDVDGVIADFHTKYVEVAKLLFPSMHWPSYEQLYSRWDVGESLGLSNEAIALVEDHMKQPGVASSLTPFPSAIESLGIVGNYVDLYFVTAPYDDSPTWVHERRRWLIRYFGMQQGSKIVHTKYKHLVDGHVFIDDNAGHIDRSVKRPDRQHTICWAYPHNEYIATKHPTVIRTNSYALLVNGARTGVFL